MNQVGSRSMASVSVIMFSTASVADLPSGSVAEWAMEPRFLRSFRNLSHRVLSNSGTDLPTAWRSRSFALCSYRSLLSSKAWISVSDFPLLAKAAHRRPAEHPLRHLLHEPVVELGHVEADERVHRAAEVLDLGAREQGVGCQPHAGVN